MISSLNKQTDSLVHPPSSMLKNANINIHQQPHLPPSINKNVASAPNNQLRDQKNYDTVAPSVKMESISIQDNSSHFENRKAGGPETKKEEGTTFNKLFEDDNPGDKLGIPISKSRSKGNVTMSFEKKQGSNVKIYQGASKQTPKINDEDGQGSLTNILDMIPGGNTNKERLESNSSTKVQNERGEIPKKDQTRANGDDRRVHIDQNPKHNETQHQKQTPPQTVESSKTMVLNAGSNPQNKQKHADIPQTSNFIQNDMFQEEIQRVKTQNLDLKTEISNLKFQIEEDKSANERQLSKIKKESDEKDGNIKRLIEERKEIPKLKKELEMKQAELEELKEMVSNLQSNTPEIGRLNNMNLANLAALEAERSNSDKLRNHIRSLEDDLRKKTEELKSTRDNLHETVKQGTYKEVEHAKEQEKLDQSYKDKLKKIENEMVV